MAQHCPHAADSVDFLDKGVVDRADEHHVAVDADWDDPGGVALLHLLPERAALVRRRFGDLAALAVSGLGRLYQLAGAGEPPAALVPEERKDLVADHVSATFLLRVGDQPPHAVGVVILLCQVGLAIAASATHSSASSASVTTPGIGTLRSARQVLPRDEVPQPQLRIKFNRHAARVDARWLEPPQVGALDLVVQLARARERGLEERGAVRVVRREHVVVLRECPQVLDGHDGISQEGLPHGRLQLRVDRKRRQLEHSLFLRRAHLPCAFHVLVQAKRQHRGIGHGHHTCVETHPEEAGAEERDGLVHEHAAAVDLGAVAALHAEPAADVALVKHHL
mmetsp:Transcript_3524/g.9811  ORF Transcript_3524/g.9811 Transcript_3524/m.9811 type:complete len:337 (+) Transcript_3524:1205-2215(+)